MRDLIAVEERGVPTALVVVGWLASIAEETKRVGGVAELSVVAVEQSLFGLARAEVEAAASVPARVAAAGLATA